MLLARVTKSRLKGEVNCRFYELQIHTQRRVVMLKGEGCVVHVARQKLTIPVVAGWTHIYKCHSRNVYDQVNVFTLGV